MTSQTKGYTTRKTAHFTSNFSKFGIDINNTDSNVGSINFFENNSNGSNYVSIKSHDSITDNYSIVLPAAIGSADEVLKISSVSGTDAICEWGAGGGGGGGSGIVNNRIDGDLTIGEDDSEILTIASKININGNEKTLPNKPFTSDKGKIVTVNAAGDDLQYGPQVLKHNMNFKNIFETGQINLTGSNPTAMSNPAVHTAMNITITPQLTTSKVMITVNMIGEWSVNPNNMVAYLRRTINGVVTDIFPTGNENRNAGLGQFVISLSNEMSSSPDVCNFHYIDEPNTILQVRYDVMLISQSTCVFYYNRTVNASNTPGGERGASFISAEEKFANDDGTVGAITSFTQEQALAGAGGTLFQSVTSSTILGSAYPLIPAVHNNIIKRNLGENQQTLLVFSNPESGWTPPANVAVSNPFIAYEFAVPQIVTSYRIWHAQDQNSGDYIPKEWELRASADSSTYVASNSNTYTLLDSQTNQSFTLWSTTGQLAASDNLDLSNLYHINTVGAFKYFVLYFKDSNDSNKRLIGVNEWALYGGGFTIPSQIGNAGKQLITNGTSLTWGSPSSILVPSPTGNANKVLQANSSGTALEYGDSGSVVGFFVQPTATVTGTYGTDGAGADYSLSSVSKTYPLQQWTIKGYGGYYMNNSNPRFGFNSGHFDCTSNSGGKFTAPSNGNYYISFNIEVTTITGMYHTIGIYINGNPNNGGTVLPNNGSGAGAYGFNYSKHYIGGINADPDTFNSTSFHKPRNHTESFIINLQQNDYVQLVVYSRSDPTYIIGKDSYFCIYKM